MRPPKSTRYTMAAKPSSRKKYGAEPRRQPKPPVPGWIWLITGCALGAFVMFLMHLSDLPAKAPNVKAVADTAKESSNDHPADNTQTVNDGKPPAKDGISQKPRYDFYRLLKENQAPSPPKADSPASSLPTPATGANDGGYILQVASYKTAEDADQLRAKLLLLNLDAKVETVTLRNADIWHRVLIGPLKNHAELTQARTILTDNKYEALVLKNTKEN